MFDSRKAPWTEEEVDNLRKFQSLEWVHPFTCCGHKNCERTEREDQGVLIPTAEGWVCPCGKYKQDWAHSHMLDGKIPPDWRIEFNKFAKERTEKGLNQNEQNDEKII